MMARKDKIYICVLAIAVLFMCWAMFNDANADPQCPAPIAPIVIAEHCVSSADVGTLKKCIEDLRAGKVPHRRGASNE